MFSERHLKFSRERLRPALIEDRRQMLRASCNDDPSIGIDEPADADTEMTDYDNLTPRQDASGEQQPLSAEELARYRELLDLAYPQPKRDLKAAVMAEIEKESGAKLPKPKKNLRKAFVRWGSLAACVALVAIIGTAVLPGRLLKTADQNAPAIAEDSGFAYAEESFALYDDADEAPAESAEAGEAAAREMPAPVPSPKSKAVTAPGSAPSANGPVVTEEPAAEEPCEEIVCEAECEAILEEPAADEAAAESVEAEAEMPAGASASFDYGMIKAAPAYMAYSAAHDCEYSSSFRDSYHNIPAALIALVGDDAWYRWQDDRLAADGCVNLVDFALDFGLSAGQIQSTGNLWYYLDVPEDIPFTDENRDALRDYYRNGGSCAEMVRRYAVYEFKTALIAEVGVSAYTSWANGGNFSSFRDWTADGLAEAFSLSGETLRAAYDKAAAGIAAEYPGYAVPTFDEITAE